jgi:hypothetical protein
LPFETVQGHFYQILFYKDGVNIVSDGFKKTKHVLSLRDLVERVMNKQRLIFLNITVAQCEDANLLLNR